MCRVSNYFLTIEVSASYITDAPLLEILNEGVVVSSVVVSAQTGFGVNTFSFSLGFSGSYPSSLSFQFNDGGSTEAGRSINFNLVEINNDFVSPLFQSDTSLTNNESNLVDTSALQNLFSAGNLFAGFAPPAASTNAIITGTGGYDNLRGSGGNDTIDGLGGSDTITTRGGDSTINGGDGNDRIFAGNGADTIYGGLGDDYVTAGGGNDLVYGDDGNDRLYGGDGDDEIHGGLGNDTIGGQGGNNLLYGDEGNDSISGSTGIDTIYGGTGDDYIAGVDANDLLYGEAGNDYIDGGFGADYIEGGDDNDTLLGKAGNDTIHGGNGNDHIRGDENDDTITGGAGNDVILGGTGIDNIDAGDGNDRIYAHSPDTTPAAMLAHYNAVKFNAPTNSFYKLITGATDYASALAAAQGTLLNGVAGHLVTINSSDENTYVQTLANGNIIWMGASDATREGAWQWQGGSENGLTFWSGAAGGSAQNGFYTNWAGGQPDNAGNADAAVMQTNGTWTDETVASSYAYIIEWDGVDIYDDNAADTVTGGNDDDIIYGGGGADILNGNAGNDIIFGGNGADTINGGAGNDTLVGGAGNDTITSASTDTLTAQINAILTANPLVSYDSTTGNFYRYMSTDNTLYTNAEANAAALTINGVSGYIAAVTSAYENAMLDALTGTRNIWVNGTDVTVEGIWRFRGGALDSLVFWIGNAGGSAQNGFYTNWAGAEPNNGSNSDYHQMNNGGLWSDQTGGTNRRYVVEWDGTDLMTPTSTAKIYGGGGQDNLYGAAGQDIFIFEAASAFDGNVDQIYNYTTTQHDKIDIADILTGFVEGSSDVDNFIRFTTAGADTLLQVDFNGGVGGLNYVTIAQINGVTGLNAEEMHAIGLLVMS